MNREVAKLVTLPILKDWADRTKRQTLMGFAEAVTTVAFSLAEIMAVQPMITPSAHVYYLDYNRNSRWSRFKAWVIWNVWFLWRK